MGGGFRSLGLAALVAVLALGGRPSMAEDAKPGAPDPPPAKAPETPKPAPAAKPAAPTIEGDADGVLAAIRAKDDAALKALAGRDVIDPWLVADELMRRGEFDAAAAFAKAGTILDVAGLPAHVEARRARPPDDADRELLDGTNAAFRVNQPQKVLDLTAALPSEADTPVRIRIAHARSMALQVLGRPKDSAVAGKRAAEAAIAIGWVRRGALIYDQAATCFLGANENAEASALLEIAVPLNDRRGDKVYAARALRMLALAQERLGDSAKALATWDEALARFEALKIQPEIAWVLFKTAGLLQRTGDRVKEFALRERAVPLLEALGMKMEAVENLNSMGTALVDAAKYDRARTTFTDALALARAIGFEPAEAGILVNLGNAYRGLGDRANALAHFERGRALAERIGHRPWLRNAVAGISLVQIDAGEHAKALAMLQKLQSMDEQAGDKVGAAAVLGRIGYVHFMRGDFTKAVAAYQQALARQEALGDRAGVAASLQALGRAYGGLGDHARALSAQEDAVARSKELGDRAGEAAALINGGNVYRDLGDTANARTRYERGLAIAEEIGHGEWRRNALHNLAGIYMDEGDPARALAAYEQELAKYPVLQPSAVDARTLRNIGSAHGRLKDSAKALEFHLRALKISEDVGDAWMVALLSGDVGCDYANAKEWEKARPYFERSERVARSRRLASLLEGALTNLAWFHLERGEPALALSAARDSLREMEGVVGGLGEEQGATARGEHAELFAVGALAAAREKDLAAAFTFLESGRAGALLDDLDRREDLRWKAESLSPELQGLDAEAQAKERTARDAYEQAVRSADRKAQQEASRALDEAMEGVRQVAGRVQRELKLQAAFFYPRARPVEEIQAALGAGQALVLYGLCEEEALALVLRRDGQRIVPLGSVADVIAECEALDAKDSTVDPTAALAALKKRLVEPLKLEEGVKEVLVSPEGPLCYLPFSLVFPQTVAMTPSGTTHALLLDEQAVEGHGVLALGDPDYAGASAGATAIYLRGQTLTPLPATRIEAKTIGTQVLVGADATEARLREVLPTTPRWRAIHFACHGLVNVEKPMLSALALTRSGDADGFFTALEVLRTKIPADLVVLSACETGTGKIVSGEGIVGLTRAFMFAGTPRVICSLWKVDDEATRVLMTKFYELWNPRAESEDPEQATRVEGLPTAEALRKAQEFVRSHEKWKHPYYWAAWVLWGLPS